MKPFVHEERYSVEDYRRWEGDWELIDGVAYAMTPSPGYLHQRLSGEIYAQLREALARCPACQALYEIDVQFSEHTVVRPDLIVICHEPEGDWITRAPELIFEIVSPRTAKRDEVLKFQLYRDGGVVYYVLIYPDSETARLWRLIDGDYRHLGDLRDGRHRFELSRCSFEFDIGRIWRR